MIFFCMFCIIYKSFSNPYKLNRNSHGSETLDYIRNNIPSNSVRADLKSENFEGFFIELKPFEKTSGYFVIFTILIKAT